MPRGVGEVRVGGYDGNSDRITTVEDAGGAPEYPCCFLCARYPCTPANEASEEAGGPDMRVHRRPFVGVSHARSWSRSLVLGAILWAFIAKN